MPDRYLPLARCGEDRPAGAPPLAGGPCWWDEALRLPRDGPRRRVRAADVPAEVRDVISAARAPICGVEWDCPRLMGILNVTPDSFSDGGRFDAPDAAAAQAARLVAAGADILDIGGESTRPGATEVDEFEEIARTKPAVRAAVTLGVPVSIDTRKATVARAAIDAGARIVNDVSAMTFDADMAATVAAAGTPVVLMHAGGPPETMQDEPRYADPVLDILDALEARRDAAVAAGIAPERIVLDPGIGFGKTRTHNLALLRDIAAFHALGHPVLLGASRKRFIGVIGNAPEAANRAPGTIAVTLYAAARGVQIHRVHDVAAHAQALALHTALREAT